IAEAFVRMNTATVELINSHGVAKGDVLTVAKVAGMLAAKQTPALIPMCHPLPIANVQLELEAGGDRVTIRATVGARARTGVEMEALTAVAIAALTIYDMCKAVDKGMRIEGIRVLEKRGGKSDWPQERVEVAQE